MLKKIRAAVGPYSKAIVGYVAPVVIAVALKWGLELDIDNVAIVLTSVITGTGVYAKRNA